MARAKKTSNIVPDEIPYTINMALPHESNALLKKEAQRRRTTVDSKLCIYCREVRPVTAFYKNKGNRAGKFTDIYCKECAQKLCTDKESVKRYFWENNRLWKDELWENARKRAETAMGGNPKYLSAKTSNETRERIQEKETALKCLGMMNFAGNYQYVQNVALGGDEQEDDGAVVTLANPDDVPTEDKMVYSRTWNGYYRQSEIEYLDAYYEQLEEAFVLDNINIQDYARKVAKASLLADTKYNEMRNGGGSPKEWQDAQNAFDSMCKSANFAACQRKTTDAGGLGSLSEIVADIEINHRAQMPKVKFPQDDIDKIQADYRHILAATQ